MAKNNSHFYTRKNYIILSLSLVFAFLLLFVGLCLDANYTIMSKKNPIALLANSMNLPQIKAGVSGFGALLVFALYVILATWAVISIFRYRHNTGKSTHSLSAWGLYILAIVVCFGLSTLISLLIFIAPGVENFGSGMTYVGECFFVALLLGIVLALLLFGVVGVILNFVKVDRPFVFFNRQSEDDLGNLPEVQAKSEEKEEERDAAKAFGDTSYEAQPAMNVVSTTNPSVVPEEATTELTESANVFPALTAIDEKYHGETVEKAEDDNVSLKDLSVGFRKYLAHTEQLYYSQNAISAFIAGFACTRLEILEGLSGTGKSSLPRYFAAYTNSKAVFLPVQASWRDKTSILGYFNDFSKTYHETDFLRNLYEASYNADQLTFFVLDEMNISRVEYYFADFLSVLEYPSEDWKIRLMQLPHGFLPPLHLDDGCVRIPTNSYFVGTANKDDSTFQISSKVYDRAFTIDFKNRNAAFEVTEDVPTIHLSASHFQSLFEESYANEKLHLTDREKQSFAKITDFISDEFDVLFGNRVEDQIDHFVPAFVACGGSKEDALDALLNTKLLSKLEGRFEDSLKDGLYRLSDLLDATYGKESFPLSRKSIQSFLRKL